MNAITFCNFASAQNQTDSLLTIAKNQGNDSNKVNVLLQLSKINFSEDPNLSIRFADSALKLAIEIGFEKGIALGNKNRGIGFYMQSNYFNAIQSWNRALESYKRQGDKVGESNINSNIGAVYFNQGDDIKALDYYLKSLKLAEEINDPLRLATVLSNIGGVYHNKKATTDKALEYFMRALPYSESIGDNDVIGSITVNIGELYYELGNNEKALEYLEKSVAAYKKQGLENIPYSFITLGKVYAGMQQYDKALEKQFEALQISKGFNAQLDIARSQLAIGTTYLEKKDYDNSIRFFLDGILIADKIKANIELKSLYQGISEAFKAKNNYSSAFKYQKLLLDIKDTLYNNETDKKLANLMFNFEIEKKEDKISLLTKDAEIKQQSLQRQKLIRNTFIAGFLVVMGFAGIFFRQRNRIGKEKKRSDELLLNILPEETAEELKDTGTAKAKSFDMVTVLFTDFKDFTKVAERLNPHDLVDEINHCFSAFDRIMEKYNIEKIKTIGDAYMAAGGLPTPNTTNPEDVLNAAIAIREFMQEYERKKMEEGKEFFRIRIGIHTGPVVAGIVGVKKFAYDIWGDTVNTSSRMESSGEVGKVNISGTTYELVKDKFRCTYRGKLEAKNKGAIDMYFVEELIG